MPVDIPDDPVYKTRMRTRTSHKWKKRPGSFDSLKTSLGIEMRGNNKWGIPDLLPQPEDLTVPADLTPIEFRRRWKRQKKVSLLQHFFLDDYRFEVCWNEHTKGIKSVTKPWLWASTTPDFSMYTNWAQAACLWNTYRTRMIGRIWQDAGALVIPTVSWTLEESYDYCFEGIPENQIVALNAKRYPAEGFRQSYIDGYKAMCKAIQPKHILVFGQAWKKLENEAPVTEFIRGKYGIYNRKEVKQMIDRGDRGGPEGGSSGPGPPVPAGDDSGSGTKK